MNKSKIDYLDKAKELINRDGGSLNLITGCRHHESDICNIDCWARRMVETRFKAHPAYPYGFEPTFHPGRVKAIGGKPKLIALNFMGDVGGDWEWKGVPTSQIWKSSAPGVMAGIMKQFAKLNPQHIILLLTKNPSWYRYMKWPENCYLGFSATNNEELERRARELFRSTTSALSNVWISLEPWMDDDYPDVAWTSVDWLVIGGLSGPKAQPVSVATKEWLLDDTVQAKRFTKDNAIMPLAPAIGMYPREYPEAWKVKNEKAD